MWSRKGTLAAAVVLLALTLAACKPGDPARSTGAYPIDIFQEMHYNQSYKAGEPPRFLPPKDSYPVSGGFIPAGPKAESADLRSPYPVDGQTLERSALLYRQNCSMCHGLTAGGDGAVGAKFQDYIGISPPAFGSGRVQGLTPGEAFASISRGVGFMSMPGPGVARTGFEGLLSEEDRWALVALIEATAAERAAALEAINGLRECRRIARLVELREGRSLGDLVDTCPA